MRQLSPELDSNSEPSPSEETKNMTGKKYGPPPSPETSIKSPLILEWSVIGPFALLEQTMIKLCQWSAQQKYYGDRLGRVSLDWHGKKQVWMLIVKIPALSFGAVTKARNMLLLTSFEEELISVTSYDGWTVILVEWKLKDLANLWTPLTSGLHQTSTRDPGTRNWMKKPSQPWKEEWKSFY